MPRSVYLLETATFCVGGSPPDPQRSFPAPLPSWRRRDQPGGVAVSVNSLSRAAPAFAHGPSLSRPVRLAQGRVSFISTPPGLPGSLQNLRCRAKRLRFAAIAVRENVAVVCPRGFMVPRGLRAVLLGVGDADAYRRAHPFA